jgi:hypothetical protein
MSVLLCRRVRRFQQRVKWSRWDKELPHVVPHTRERRSREPVKTLFHFHVGWASARAWVPSDVARQMAVQTDLKCGCWACAFPKSNCVRFRSAAVSSHQVMEACAKRARVLQAGYPAPLRIDGNWVSAPVLEMRKGRGAHQHQALASARCVPFECVAQGCALRQTSRGVQCHGTMRYRERPAQPTAMQQSACD